MQGPARIVGGGYHVWLGFPPLDWRPDSAASVPPVARLLKRLHDAPWDSCQDASLVVLGFNLCLLAADRPADAPFPVWAILVPVEDAGPAADPNAN